MRACTHACTHTHTQTHTSMDTKTDTLTKTDLQDLISSYYQLSCICHAPRSDGGYKDTNIVFSPYDVKPQPCS